MMMEIRLTGTNGKEAENQNTIISQLPPESIRWMNKRKTNITDRVTSHILPSRVKELRIVYDNFDYNKTGSITIDMLKDAVSYHNNNNLRKDQHLSNSKIMDKFFFAMDANKDGSITFAGNLTSYVCSK